MNTERLYELLPVIIRQQDAAQGEPLHALLQIIAEQADILEQDISQLYDNWFIETCADWVVPYIGDLLAYRTSSSVGAMSLGLMRREIANTIRSRRRKGTLSLLEELAGDTTGWATRVLEMYPLLAHTQSMQNPTMQRGLLASVRNGEALDRLNGAFDSFAHTLDLRNINSHRDQGRYNLSNVAAFIWRLKTYSVTHTPAANIETINEQCYTFSVLGNNAQLFTRSEPEIQVTDVANELNLPIPIGRRALERHPERYSGEDKRFMIWVGIQEGNTIKQHPVMLDQLIAADLTDWKYRPSKDNIAVDPVLGRIMVSSAQTRRLKGLWVSYYYGFSDDLGGGEYERPLREAYTPLHINEFDLNDATSLANAWKDHRNPLATALANRLDDETQALLVEFDGNTVSDALKHGLVRGLNAALETSNLVDVAKLDAPSFPAEIKQLIAQQPHDADLQRLNRWILETGFPTEIAPHHVHYRVGDGQEYATLTDAINRWSDQRPRSAVIEICDSDTYRERLNITINRGQSLQIRAVRGVCPVIYLLDWHPNRPDSLKFYSETGGCIVLDGLLITGRSVHVSGAIQQFVLRHCTLVPGWGLDNNCNPHRPNEPSLELDGDQTCVSIEHSIIGSIYINHDEVQRDPLKLHVSDSIIDATRAKLDAISTPQANIAHCILTCIRTTVLGQVKVHAIQLAEDTIFTGMVHVARRQIGCLRFCFVPKDSRTPRRYNCQPDLVQQAVKDQQRSKDFNDLQVQAEQDREQQRVQPQFNSVRYGKPEYCQLARSCASEITTGAHDEAEMGVFHNLYQPQRAANLVARLDEYLPAGAEFGIISMS